MTRGTVRASGNNPGRRRPGWQKPTFLFGGTMKLVAAPKNRDLGEILDLIGVCVQLTDTQFKDAESKYKAVSAWLNAENSPLQAFEPDIFPQGSLRLDTTVKPLSHT